jgi:hypothetical protein
MSAIQEKRSTRGATAKSVQRQTTTRRSSNNANARHVNNVHNRIHQSLSQIKTKDEEYRNRIANVLIILGIPAVVIPNIVTAIMAHSVSGVIHDVRSATRDVSLAMKGVPDTLTSVGKVATSLDGYLNLPSSTWARFMKRG